MNNEINYVSPFKKFVITIGNLPTAYMESMSYYEAITFLVNYLSNNVIPALNNNGLVVEELQAKFTELKNYVDNYFENLDVQEEINNKLDDMADSGQLADLIAQYLGLAGMITFDTVTDMKAAENLVDGSKCQTLGFHTVNDGGNALYKVRTITNDDVVDEKLIIALNDDSLIAELIIENNTINVLKIGIKNDESADSDLSVISSYINNYDFFIPDGTYLLSDDLILERDNTYLTCKGKIKIDNTHSIILKANNCNIFIHNLENGNNNGIGFIITNKDGISTINNNIKIDNIIKTDIGLLLNGNYSKGIQYNKFIFNEIDANTGIKITLTSINSWVNENQFFGGRIKGTLGVEVKKINSQINNYDGNKFYNIGFEELEKICTLENAKHFIFSGLRTQESITGATWISFDNNSSSNEIYSLFRLYINKISDTHTSNNEPNIIHANSIATSNGNYVSDKLKFISQKPFIYNRPYYRVPITSYYNYGDITVNESLYYNNMMISCGCDSDKTLNLILPSIFNDNGVSEFILRASYLGSNTTLNIKDSNNNIIYTKTTTTSESNKFYKFIKNFYTDTELSPSWLVTSINN